MPKAFTGELCRYTSMRIYSISGEEYSAVRKATLTLLNSLSGEALARIGVVGESKVSVRALAWMITGHEIHHVNSIRENYM